MLLLHNKFVFCWFVAFTSLSAITPLRLLNTIAPVTMMQCLEGVLDISMSSEAQKDDQQMYEVVLLLIAGAFLGTTVRIFLLISQLCPVVWLLASTFVQAYHSKVSLTVHQSIHLWCISFLFFGMFHRQDRQARAAFLALHHLQDRLRQAETSGFMEGNTSLAPHSKKKKPQNSREATQRMMDILRLQGISLWRWDVNEHVLLEPSQGDKDELVDILIGPHESSSSQAGNTTDSAGGLGWPWNLLPQQEYELVCSTMSAALGDEDQQWHKVNIVWHPVPGKTRCLRIAVRRAGQHDAQVEGTMQDMTEVWEAAVAEVQLASTQHPGDTEVQKAPQAAAEKQNGRIQRPGDSDKGEPTEAAVGSSKKKGEGAASSRTYVEDWASGTQAEHLSQDESQELSRGDHSTNLEIPDNTDNQEVRTLSGTGINTNRRSLGERGEEDSSPKATISRSLSLTRSPPKNIVRVMKFMCITLQDRPSVSVKMHVGGDVRNLPAGWLEMCPPIGMTVLPKVARSLALAHLSQECLAELQDEAQAGLGKTSLEVFNMLTRGSVQDNVQLRTITEEDDAGVTSSTDSVAFSGSGSRAGSASERKTVDVCGVFCLAAFYMHLLLERAQERTPDFYNEGANLQSISNDISDLQIVILDLEKLIKGIQDERLSPEWKDASPHSVKMPWVRTLRILIADIACVATWILARQPKAAARREAESLQQQALDFLLQRNFTMRSYMLCLTIAEYKLANGEAHLCARELCQVRQQLERLPGSGLVEGQPAMLLPIILANLATLVRANSGSNWGNLGFPKQTPQELEHEALKLLPEVPPPHLAWAGDLRNELEWRRHDL